MQRQLHRKRLACEGERAVADRQIDIARQEIETERVQKAVPVEHCRKHSALCRYLGENAPKIERKEVCDQLHRIGIFCALCRVEPQRLPEQTDYVIRIGTETDFVYRQEDILPGVFQRDDLSRASRREQQLRTHEKPIQPQAYGAGNIERLRFQIDLCAQISR